MCVFAFLLVLAMIVISEPDKVNPAYMERSQSYDKKFRCATPSFFGMESEGVFYSPEIELSAHLLHSLCCPQKRTSHIIKNHARQFVWRRRQAEEIMILASSLQVER